MSTSEDFEREKRRIEDVYGKRAHDASLYHWSRPDVLLRQFSLRERYARCLEEHGFGDVSRLDVLDVGCGDGGWLRTFLEWGASPSRLHGVDLQEKRVEKARLLSPHLDFRVAAGALPFPERSFDLVTAHTVFSSILDPELRLALAAEMRRVVRPGGLVVLFDFWTRRPGNRNTVGITKAEVRRLFPGRRLACRSLVLAPPIARRLAPLSASLAMLVEGSLPFLRTHRLYLLKEP